MSGSLHSLPTAGFTVGRSLDASLIVDDVGVSREHAKLYWQDGLWWVEDLGSQNGTYVDGRSIQRSALHDGALVRFGPSASYSFQLMDEHHEAAVKQLFEKSHHDPLLGIYNRRYLENRLGMELSFAMRHETTLSLVLFDIDHFKRINDTLGHQAGDEVLKQVARLIGLQLRTEDVFARYGGEEFAILLRDVGSLGAAVVAERVRKQLDASPLRVDGGDVVVTASAGCASFSECDPPTAEQLVALADDRLYQAKRSGRNRVVME
jgi:diguanylate cyclase (GGDEF)-like protein